MSFFFWKTNKLFCLFSNVFWLYCVFWEFFTDCVIGKLNYVFFFSQLTETYKWAYVQWSLLHFAKQLSKIQLVIIITICFAVFWPVSHPYDSILMQTNWNGFFQLRLFSVPVWPWRVRIPNCGEVPSNKISSKLCDLGWDSECSMFLILNEVGLSLLSLMASLERWSTHCVCIGDHPVEDLWSVSFIN